MSWYVPSTVNNLPDDHYIFINNAAEVAAAAAGYPASLFTQYSKMDVVLVGGGGTGGNGGSGGEGLTGGGGGSGNRIGYIAAQYTDPSTGNLYDYTIAPASVQTITLSSYTFSSIVVSVGGPGSGTTLSLTGATLAGSALSPSDASALSPSAVSAFSPLTAGAGSNGNGTGGGNGFNGGGSGGRKDVQELPPGSGDTANGGQNGFGLSGPTPGYGGGVGAGNGGPNGGAYYEGGGGGGSGVRISNGGTTITTGGNGNQAAPGYYSGAGGGGGTYSDAPGQSGAPGYAILRFYN